MKFLVFVKKAIKNPKRAGAAVCRRLRAFFKKYYFWLRFQTKCIPTIQNDTESCQFIIPQQFKVCDHNIITAAYDSLKTYGNFLGVCIDDELPPWHEDVRLRPDNGNRRFFPKAWYANIIFSIHQGEGLGPDIKVPWMLGRLHHIALWSYAYYHIGDEQFLTKIITHLEDFLEKNPAYFGVQWMCTMEVALRAINMILSISMIHESLSSNIKKRLLQSLKYHWWYIQNHWEIYDGKTNNHYLANLVGYWYLCAFFTMQENMVWCAQRLVQEVEKQFLADGTFYEGSTAYHRLSTDLVALALVIDEKNLLVSLQDSYVKMEQLCATFHYNEHEMILIGDNDSSPVIHPKLLKIVRQYQQVQGVFTLKNFGLQVYKNDELHFTLRHHAYAARQPSGHFHNDCNAITFALCGQLCIVDPGIYVYTASLPWRNFLRAPSAHATCFVQNMPKYTDCFVNNIKEKKHNGSVFSSEEFVAFVASCNCNDFVHERYMMHHVQEKKMMMYDYIRLNTYENVVWQLPIRGRILCVSDEFITIDTNGIVWQLHIKQQKWSIEDNFYAPGYGSLEKIHSIRIYNPTTIELQITWN